MFHRHYLITDRSVRIKQDDKREVIQYFRNHNALNKINVCQSVQPQNSLVWDIVEFENSNSLHEKETKKIEKINEEWPH